MSDNFLSRWSRRKIEVRAQEKEGLPVAEVAEPSLAQLPAQQPADNFVNSPSALAAPVDSAAPELPLPTELDLAAVEQGGDIKAFLMDKVAPELKNKAFKALFSRPEFNVMDGLDIYIDDYTQPDPLPAGMLRQMASAHAMGFFDHEKKADAAPDVPVNGAAVEASADAEAIAPALAQPRDDAEGHAPADVAQSGVCNAIPSAPSSELEMATRPHKDAVAMPASHTEHDHDAHLRLQPDDAPQREGVGRGAA